VSVVAVGFSRLVCDGCGTEHPELATDATSARIKAAPDGWKFRQYDARKGTGVPRNQKGPRQWDACPKCEIPETSDAAMAAGKARPS
jgi:hypothetical protein